MNPDAYFNYTPNEIDNCMNASNKVWYYLKGRYDKHGKGLFDDTRIEKYRWNESINESIKIIDSSKSINDLDRNLLADFGSYFHDKLLPEFYDMTIENIGIPKRTLNITNCLVLILCAGVIVPLITQSLSLKDYYSIYITEICIASVITSIIYFIIEFYILLKEETDLFK